MLFRLSVYIITCIFHLFGESKRFCRFLCFDCSPSFLMLLHPPMGKLTLLIIPTGQTWGNIPQEGNMYIMPQQHLGIRRGKFIQSHIIRWVCVASLPLFPGRSNERGCTVSILQLLNFKKNEKIECLCAETSMWFTKWIICYMHASISNQVLHVYVFFIYKKRSLVFLQLSKNQWKIVTLDLLLSFSFTEGIKVSTLVSWSHTVVRGGNDSCSCGRCSDSAGVMLTIMSHHM